jgi:hypothetical protein
MVKRIRSGLLTLLLLFIVLSLVKSALEQYLGLIIIGIIVITVALIIFKGRRL